MNKTPIESWFKYLVPCLVEFNVVFSYLYEDHHTLTNAGILCTPCDLPSKVVDTRPWWAQLKTSSGVGPEVLGQQALCVSVHAILTNGLTFLSYCRHPLVYCLLLCPGLLGPGLNKSVLHSH